MNRPWMNRSATIFLALSLACSADHSRHFEVVLNDPVKPEEPAKTYELELVFDDQGLPEAYHLFLRTDVCLDRVCELLETELVWDALGYFDRIAYARNRPLTKNDHDPFTPEDYRRLDQILKDRHSLLGRQPLEFFLLRPEERNDVDGVTTATPQSVKDAVVGGAAYSTWALWHWANGEIVDDMLAITRRFQNDAFLLKSLQSGQVRSVRYALRALAENPSKDPGLRDTCLELLETADEATCRLALDVLLADSATDLPGKLMPRVGVNPASTRMLLEAAESFEGVDPEVWDLLSGQLRLLDQHHDLKIALNLLADRAKMSNTVQENVNALLDRNDPILRFRIRKFAK